MFKKGEHHVKETITALNGFNTILKKVHHCRKLLSIGLMMVLGAVAGFQNHGGYFTNLAIRGNRLSCMVSIPPLRMLLIW